uniref:Uncharacterized protein n=1 Tax=Romanomermis culicivorax TaxID=13658 RepID=A0A915I100_ROMCU
MTKKCATVQLNFCQVAYCNLSFAIIKSLPAANYRHAPTGRTSYRRSLLILVKLP